MGVILALLPALLQSAALVFVATKTLGVDVSHHGYAVAAVILGFPLAYALLGVVAPRVGAALGLVLCIAAAAGCAALACFYPGVRTWPWIPDRAATMLASGFFGLVLASLANFAHPFMPFLLAAQHARTLRQRAAARRTRPRADRASRAHERADPTDQTSDPEEDRSAPNGSDPWTVLGVPPGATRETIRGAYFDRMREYHPDRVANLGAELRKPPTACLIAAPTGSP